MKLRAAAVAATVAAAAPAALAATFVGSYGGHDYFVTDTKGTVFDARLTAIDLGGSLVTINDAAEEAWLRERVGNEKLFIGLSDEDTEATWTWDNAESVTYTNWASGEPNDYGSGEDYVLMNWKSNGQWNDINGTSNYRAVIEVVPTPGSAAIAAVGVAAFARRRR